MRKPLAVLTMCFNEAIMLPIWQRHYGREVGPQNCFVLDHGSDDGSVDRLDCRINVERLPRSPHDEDRKVALVAETVERLLRDYERVLFTDTDEMVIADPRQFGGLLDFCRRRHADVVTTFGLNVMPATGAEAQLDLAKPILGQRRWVQATAFLCKPTLVHRRTVWCAGFHLADAPTITDDLYLFHLAYMDTGITLDRQIVRNSSVPTQTSESHHAYSPGLIIEWFNEHFASKPRSGSVDLAIGCTARDSFESALHDGTSPPWNSRITNLELTSDLWPLPERFYGLI